MLALNFAGLAAGWLRYAAKKAALAAALGWDTDGAEHCHPLAIEFWPLS